MKVYSLDQDELEAQWRESIGALSQGEPKESEEAEAAEAEKPTGGICWGALPGVALGVLPFLFKPRGRSGKLGGTQGNS
jgi:hypothetical protein